MTTLKTLAIVAAFLAGGTSLAMAQNGPATGAERPVAGGAAGGGPPGPGVIPGDTRAGSTQAASRTKSAKSSHQKTLKTGQ
jgi:hypothetical protein